MRSQALCDRLHSIDYRKRSVTFLDKTLPTVVMNEIVQTVLDLINPVEVS